MPRYTHIVCPLLLGWLTATAPLSSAQSPALLAVNGPARAAATSTGPAGTATQAVESPGEQVIAGDTLQLNVREGNAGTDIIKSSSNLKLSYNSSLIYPGMRVGIETPIKRVEVTKFKKSGAKKDILKDRFLTGNLSWYHHADFHDNLYLTAGYTLRRTKANGFFTEFCPEIGYSRTFLGGTTYTVNDRGDVAIKKNAGYNYLLASIGLGLGYDFSIKGTTPVAAFYKLNLITMFPYNSFLYVRPAMEIGVIYTPKNFLSFNTKIKKR